MPDAQTLDAVVELADPKVRLDPYPMFSTLREMEPVHFSPRGNIYLLSRYADSQFVLHAPENVFRRLTQAELAEQQPGFAKYRYLASVFDTLALKSSPVHTRLRRLITRDFTTGRVDGLSAKMARSTERQLDALAEPLCDGETIDLCQHVEQLPVSVISELLGIPESDRTWLAPLVTAEILSLSPTATAEQMQDADGAFDTLMAYFAELIAYRRATPRDDLISALLSEHQDNPDRLSEDELLTMIQTLWTGGFETTVSAVEAGVFTLMNHRQHIAQLCAGHVDLTVFANEILRHNSPVIFSPLAFVAASDVEVGGITVPAGARVHAMLGAANRDPEAFPDPDTFVPSRRGAGHLTFSSGIHRCVGAPLAIAEMSIYLTRLFTRFPQLSLAGEIELNPIMYMRSYKSIPVSLDGPHALG